MFSHRVTVEDVDGRIYYQSNELLGDEEQNLWWHADRLSDDEWDDYYKGNDDEDGYSWLIPQADHENFTDECRRWLIRNKVVKDLRQLLADVILVLLVICITGCEIKTSDYQEIDGEKTEAVSVRKEADRISHDVFEKGYNLPIAQSDTDRAKKEMNDMLDIIESMYLPYINNEYGEIEVPEDVQENMADILATKGYLVRTDGLYSNIKNEEILESFLADAEDGREGSVVLYEFRTRGAVARYNYSFDGSDMYVLASGIEIKSDSTRCQTYCSYTRLKSWRYTDTGWFCYELCVPEYPEVTEIVDGSVLIRVKPISEENRQASEKYVLGIGYQGNNILCSNWDIDSLDTLDYTGMYEYLYAMDTGKRFCLDEDAEGIPVDEFEALIMKYIPTSREMIRKNAAYNKEKGEYYWVRLGCMNYTPTYFGTSIPEVVDIKENGDGTIALTVNAVCEMVLNDEAIITHELIIKDNSDGSFMYMGNKILDDGVNKIPRYQYRIRMSCGDKESD